MGSGSGSGLGGGPLGHGVLLWDSLFYIQQTISDRRAASAGKELTIRLWHLGDWGICEEVEDLDLRQVVQYCAVYRHMEAELVVLLKSTAETGPMPKEDLEESIATTLRQRQKDSDILNHLSSETKPCHGSVLFVAALL